MAETVATEIHWVHHEAWPHDPSTLSSVARTLYWLNLNAVSKKPSVKSSIPRC